MIITYVDPIFCHVSKDGEKELKKVLFQNETKSINKFRRLYRLKKNEEKTK